MKYMRPMGLTSTPFIKYHELNLTETDLIGDAWGFSSVYGDVFFLLGEIKPEPGDELISQLIEHISEIN
jgi:hypothetical protein